MRRLTIMKTTLEKALAEARPEPKPSGYPDFDAALKAYVVDTGLRDESIQAIRDVPINCQQLVKSWRTLGWLMGLVYWISRDYDGSIWRLLNITPEEQATICQGMDLLRTKLTNYKKVTKNTDTQMLYDEISARNF